MHLKIADSPYPIYIEMDQSVTEGTPQEHPEVLRKGDKACFRSLE